MSAAQPARKSLPEHDAALAALVFAVDPHAVGGAILHGLPGPHRERWLSLARALQPADTPWLKVPVSVTDDRLLGGLDFAATLGSGRPVHATGLLEAADGGALLLSMAERAAPRTAAAISAALDRGGYRLEREGHTRFCATRFGVIAFDESVDEEQGVVAGLADRLAFSVRFSGVPIAALTTNGFTAADVREARQRLASLDVDDDVPDLLCQAAAVFGIQSLRAELLALRVARAIGALHGRSAVQADDAVLAARLVLPQRATMLPPVDAPDEDEAPPEAPPEEEDDQSRPTSTDMPDEILVDAVAAAIPPGLLAQLQAEGAVRRKTAAGGRGGPQASGQRRGRPIGVRAVDRPGDSRLNVLATLKAAAPWQTLRRDTSPQRSAALHIRPGDLRATRFRERMETTTLFVVDASGSQAARRLAEVKGAIEILLNDCYVRRDQVGMIAFRGKDAETILPPTRALARARRSLAALPGGGGTPLAAGLDAARELAESVAHHGRVPAIVLMTDGRANIASDRSAEIELAEQDALQAAARIREAGFRSLLVDTSQRPRPRARAIAEAMGARYVPLPRADAAAISATVRAAA